MDDLSNTCVQYCLQLEWKPKYVDIDPNQSQYSATRDSEACGFWFESKAMNMALDSNQSQFHCYASRVNG